MKIRYNDYLPDKMPTRVDEKFARQLHGRLTDDSKLAIVRPYTDEAKKANYSRTMKIRTDVYTRGFGSLLLVSKWIEGGKSFDEECLIAYGISKRGAIKLGQRFDLTSIVHKDDSGCYEYLTYTRDEFEHNSVGELIKTFDLSGDSLRDVPDIKELFTSRKPSPISRLIKEGDEQLGDMREKRQFELFEKIRPRPSYFQTDYSFNKII